MASSGSDSSDESGGLSSEDDNILHQPSAKKGIIVPTAFDAYFTHNAAKAQTSTNVFSTLVNPLSHEEYTEASASFPEPFESKLLTDESFRTSMFDRMMLELRAGFNVLCYGYGSKRDILNRFARERCAKRGHVAIADAYNPQFTFKDILNSIESLPELEDVDPTSSSSIEAQTRRIQELFAGSKRHLYLIIHSIDAPALRTSKAKSCLSILALNPNIHLIASIDHINAPLLWTSSDSSARKEDTPDAIERRGFAWLWHDMTTLTPYDIELAYADRSSISGARRTQKSTNASASVAMSETAALHILASVTSKAKKLFTLMADKQLALDTGTVPQQELAITYDRLFNAAREQLIATSDTALRSLLGEFRDHELVVGSDALWIPLRKERLANVLAKMEETPS